MSKTLKFVGELRSLLKTRARVSAKAPWSHLAPDVPNNAVCWLAVDARTHREAHDAPNIGARAIRNSACSSARAVQSEPKLLLTKGKVQVPLKALHDVLLDKEPDWIPTNGPLVGHSFVGTLDGHWARRMQVDFLWGTAAFTSIGQWGHKPSGPRQ
eukprot:9499526-Pyramimonas_sp.AAC.1